MISVFAAHASNPRIPGKRVAFILAFGLTVLAASLFSQEALTNAKIIAMTKAGVKPTAILAQINKLPGHYTITPDALIALKNAGVADEVIEAMTQKMNATEAQTSAQNDRSSVPDSTWKISVLRDKLTDEPTVQATRSTPVQDRAKVLTTASCGISKEIVNLNARPDMLAAFLKNGLQTSEKDSRLIAGNNLGLDTRAFSFDFKYVPSTSKVSLRRSALSQTVAINRAGQGTVSAARSCTFLRVMVDDRGREGVQSTLCNRENEASIVFSNIHARDINRAFIPGGSFAAGSKNDALGTLLGGGIDKMLSTAADMSDTTIATMDEVFRAQNIRVELPLTNDDSVLVRIDPQESSFRNFVATCSKTFPAPSPTPKQNTSAALPPKPPTDPLALPKPQGEPIGPVYTTPIQPRHTPTSSAVLSVRNTLHQQPNPLANQIFYLERETLMTTTRRTLFDGCTRQHVNCDQLISALTADPVATVHADMSGNADFPPVPAGRYFEVIFSRNPDQTPRQLWYGFIQLNPGNNVFEADETNGMTLIATVASVPNPDNPFTNAINGLAVLTVTSGFRNSPNPLARAPMHLMRDDLSTTLQNSGIRVPAGIEPPDAFRRVCRTNTANCDARLLRASIAGAASTRAADLNGNAVLPPVQPGDYYILIYGYDASHRHVYWHEKITLKAGGNIFVASAENAQLLR